MNDQRTIKDNIIPDNTVNARDLRSPLPLLRLKKELAVMKADDIVRIDCTDFESLDDIESWCDRMNNNFLGEKGDENVSSYYIQKKS